MIFVGERRSRRAVVSGVTWRDGRLAAKQLFDALISCGITPAHHEFVNAFERGCHAKIMRYLRTARDPVVVGLGRLAQARLESWGFRHLKLVHPAARGAIRRKDRYAAHVRFVLGEVPK